MLMEESRTGPGRFSWADTVNAGGEDSQDVSQVPSSKWWAPPCVATIAGQECVTVPILDTNLRWKHTYSDD